MKVKYFIINFFKNYDLKNIFKKIVIDLVMFDFLVIIEPRILGIMDFNLNLIIINSFVKKKEVFPLYYCFIRLKFLDF